MQRFLHDNPETTKEIETKVEPNMKKLLSSIRHIRRMTYIGWGTVLCFKPRSRAFTNGWFD